MANYINNSLEEGERIIFNGRLHWTAIASYITSSGLAALAGIVIMALAAFGSHPELLWVGGVALLVAFIIYVAGCIVRTRSEFAVTTSRFIQKDGILNISMTEIPLFKIETVNFHQTFLQRLLDTGCIELVGSGGTTHRIHAIEHPMEVRKVIVGIINRAEQDRKE